MSRWPRWLSQRLCKHKHTRVVGWGRGTVGESRTLLVCENCHQRLSIPVYCRHPYDKWKVISTEIHETEVWTKKEIPSSWQCTDCGYLFHKDMQCPSCHMYMKITEWKDEFSGRFHCETCGGYYFREELENYG